MSLLITGGLGVESLAESLTLLSAEASATQLVLTFDASMVVLDPAEDPAVWLIDTVGGVAVTVTGVTVEGGIIYLDIGEQTEGETYTLTIPEDYVLDVSGRYPTDLEVEFTGYGIAPTMPIARSIDARTLRVVFSEDVMTEDAILPENYTISGGLTISAVESVSATTYVLTTSKQTAGEEYTITAVDIRDLAGNPVA